MDKNKLNIRLYDTFGCTIVATVLIQSLRIKFPKTKIIVYTKNPDLIKGLKEVDKIINVNLHSLKKYDIDLTNYLGIRKPQKNFPLRHLSEHMFEMAEEQLGNKLKGRLRRNFLPKVILTKSELDKGRKIVSQVSKGKPVIWIQTKSRVKKKEWNRENWQELLTKKSDSYKFINLSSGVYSKRISMAITKACFGGITIDTFLIHGSKAVNAKNVITILVSSHPKVVTYKDQIILDGTKNVKNISPQAVAGKMV